MELTFQESVEIEVLKALLTAVFVAGAAALVVRYYQDKSAARQAEVEQARAEAEKDRERSMDAARAKRETQYDFVRRTSELAGSFYFATQQYWRCKQHPDIWGSPDVAGMDGLYLEWASRAEVLETELEARYGEGEQAPLRWHQVRDLLTVRYFDLRDRNTEKLREKNADGYLGGFHSGLTVAELGVPGTILATYRQAMELLARELQSADLLI